MSKAVGVMIDGEVSWHAPASGAGDYDTLCGIDANDPEIGHAGTVEPKRGRKIECASCRGIWEAARPLRATDFA